MQKVWVVIYNVTEKVNPENTTSSCRVYSNYDKARQEIADFVKQENEALEYWVDTFDNIPII